ncbi:MAG: thioredoxin reductase [Gemmatimonadales bacterium]|nr:thioredoxin reductase [Gemmatimonadales bacterium]
MTATEGVVQPSSAAAMGERVGVASHPKLIEGEVRVIGRRWSPRVHAIKAFLARSRVPYRWLDEDRDGAGPTAAESTVLFPDGSLLVDPEVRDVARRLGLEIEPDSSSYDLVVVGGGPAGLAASIYGASEGMHTVVVEQDVPGGQASYSAIIENYPGFPEGLSGSDLARRMIDQAERFGVEILVTRKATALGKDGDDLRVTLEDGTELSSTAVLITTGVTFRWLDAPGCASLVGAGIYYGAATAEATACRGQDIYILGGGNSAGQAALLLSQYARRVVILTVEDSLEKTMSKYLIDRIPALPNVQVRTNSTVVGADGDGHLEWLTIEDVRTGATERVRAGGLFVFIGASPDTRWLEGVVARDPQGFILAGPDLKLGGKFAHDWPLDRDPYMLETSQPGVFVAGDVRKGSIKRLASAVGEGAMAVQFVHACRRQQATH